MNFFDVVVLGAGPSGCAAAIQCAQRGLRVALLEKSLFPRHRPGETLHPGVEPLLRQLGVDIQHQACLRHSGHWVHWEGPPRFHSFGGNAWSGFQIPRELLDQQLLERAHTAGVQVLQPKRISLLLHPHGRVLGVRADTTQWRAHYVVDASGRHRWLQRQLQLPYLRYSPRLIAQYGYCQNVHLQPEALGLFARPHGWHWIARISDTCLHWTELYVVESAKRGSCPPVLSQCTAIGPTRGADVSWRRCRNTAGPGYFLAGDAATTVDPCAAHGVIKALVCGMQAASVIVDCLSRPSGEAIVQAAYQAWVQEAFARDVTALRSFYQTHPHPPAWVQA